MARDPGRKRDLFAQVLSSGARFHFRWRAASGRHTLMTRATDRHGSTQPASVPFNNGGYLFNAVHPHPVIVN